MNINLNLFLIIFLVCISCNNTNNEEKQISIENHKETLYEQPSKFLLNEVQESTRIEKYFLEAKRTYGIDGLKRMQYIAKLTDRCNSYLKRESSTIEFKISDDGKLTELKLINETNPSLISCIEIVVEKEGLDELKQQEIEKIRLDLVNYGHNYFEMLWNKRLLEEQFK